MVNIFGYISESKYMVPSTGKNKTRLRLDQLGLSLLRGLHVCFVSFEGLTHAKQGKVADWKHQTPIQPKHEATSRSSCRRCLSSASSACSTCPHLQSQAITDQWWIAPLGHRICLKNPKTMHSLAPKNWFQNDIEIQIRHVSPPSSFGRPPLVWEDGIIWLSVLDWPGFFNVQVKVHTNPWTIAFMLWKTKLLVGRLIKCRA